MNKEEFVLRLKDPLYAESKRLDSLVESLVEGNKVETLPGRSLMYITVFMGESFIHGHELRELGHKVRLATKGWWLESCVYAEDRTQITLGFRAR